MMVKEIVKVALDKVNEAEAYIIEKEILTIRIADKRIMEAKGTKENAAAIRLVKDKIISGVRISLLDKEHIERCIDNVIGNKNEEWKGFPGKANIKPFNGYDQVLQDLNIEDFCEMTNYTIDDALRSDIDNLSGGFHLVKEKVELANSNSLELKDKATYILASINADKDNVSGIGFSASRSLNNFKPNEAANKAVEMAIRSSNPQRCYEDHYSIIFEPYAFGELLSFVFAYNFNAKMYRDKRSCLYNKLGQKIAVDNLTLYDDPRIEDGLGSKPFDDEGIETKTNTLIEKGIFKNIIYDMFYAYKDNIITTANGLRLGYPVGRSAEPLPYPSMHNIVIEKGDYSNEEIIKDTKKGLLVGRLWYTYPVNPEQGDFSCTARSGIFLIENGEIRYPCKMVRIIDNLKRLMLNISAISKERMQVLQWHAIPCITPTIRVDGIKAIPL